MFLSFIFKLSIVKIDWHYSGIYRVNGLKFYYYILCLNRSKTSDFSFTHSQHSHLFIYNIYWACRYFLSFIFLYEIHRELDVKGISTFSKCKMYNVNWTTIQSWDYENWNSTKYHEKLDVIGKYWQVIGIKHKRLCSIGN